MTRVVFAGSLGSSLPYSAMLRKYMLTCVASFGRFDVCQQWFSVVGNLTEIVGFLLVVREWYHVFSVDALQRRNRIERDFERTRTEQEGRKWVDPSSADHTMWREFQRLLIRDLRYRKRIFFGGSALVVFGACLQMAGNWPGGVFGIRGC